MDEYLCLTLLSRPCETEAGFAARLSVFWTRMLRERPDDFAKVYAERTAFEIGAGGVLARQYLIRVEVADVLAEELQSAGIAYEAIDPEEPYSRYEAPPPEWMQIEH